MSELERRFHEVWLGMVQPTEGLVVSVPVLVDGQVMDRTRSVEHQQALGERCSAAGEGEGAARARAWIEDWEGVLTGLLGWSERSWDAGEALLGALALYVPEGPQTIVPTLAVRRPGGAAGEAGVGAGEVKGDESPAVVAGRRVSVLVWDLAAPRERGGAGAEGVGLSLDKPEAVTGKWEYPPAAKLDRLLRSCRVPIGILTNREVVRLVYAPHGESSGSITFRVADMLETGGRPILDAFVGLLHHRRLFVLAEDRRLPALLAESRRRQANVTNELADQVFEALEALLAGVQAAAERDGEEGRQQLLAALEREGDHLYGGLLTVLLRLVFLLYAEDRGLMPVEHALYERHMSVLGLFERLQADAGAHPDSMFRRFGAWDRLVATWRAVFLGVDHGDLHMPPRHGQLFDPHLYPFIEGWGPGGSAPIVQPEARAAVKVPSIDDGTVLTVLEKLVVFQGQRLSYRALDVEQIGSVYEALMGYHAVQMPAAAVSLRPQRARRVWVTAREVLEVGAGRRAAWCKEEVGLGKASAEKLAAALAGVAKAEGKERAEDEREREQAVLAVLHEHGGRGSVRVEAGQVVIQPGAERRRTSSHYTPRSLTAPIVERTLEPLIAAMGEAPGAELLLSLKICDPAMGSGAFLVEVCRQLAEHVVAAWTREGVLGEVASKYGDPVMHARRMVAQRCVYGVDKNAFAVNLAKLSLWLVTLAKDLPFTFVDHALRHGDSLVGLGFEQIRGFHWKVGEQVELFGEEIKAALDEAVGLRQEICELARDESKGALREKERLLRDAEDALSRVRLIGDVIVGAFFAEEKDKARDKERVRRMGVVSEWLRGGEAPTEELLRMQAEVLERTPVFHWMVEFPEVFYGERADPLEGGRVNRAAFMDAFVGNPPFAGKNAVSQLGANAYMPFLQAILSDIHGNCDLCGYFLRRCAELLGHHGALGMIATNTVSEGDTRMSTIVPLLLDGFGIYHAIRSQDWPGAASVSVTVLHMAKGAPLLHTGECLLDGQPAVSINSRLRGKPERGTPHTLHANVPLRFMGSKIYGNGFILDNDEVARLLELEKAAPVFPLIGGAELNSSPTLDADRMVINFHQLSLVQAEQWPCTLAIVRERVKPERDRARDNADGSHRKKYWWQFAQPRPELYQAIEPLSRCLAAAIVSKHLIFAFQPRRRIFSHKLYVFPFERYAQFALLQSRVHVPWAWLLSSTMRDAGINYSASDCFDSFAFPNPDPRSVLPSLEDIGERLYTARAEYMVATNQGLTKTYNALKDPANTDQAILALRELHLELDRAVLAAYGWSDIEVPPFTEPVTPAEQAARQAFEDEVIDRLFVLNAERAKEEERAGLSGGKKGKKTAKKKAAKKDDGGQQSLV